MDLIDRLFGIDRGYVRLTGAGDDAEALLIVTGLGIPGSGWRALRRFFGETDYDLFLPDYLRPGTLADATSKLQAFIDREHLERYRAVHIYANILGSWVVNLCLRERPLANLRSIVYNRSPIQERVFAVVDERLRITSRLIVGRIIGDLARTPYPVLTATGVRVGLIIENRANLIMQLLRRPTLRMGPFDFDPDSFGQPHDDAIQVPLDHTKIYTRIDTFGEALLHFFREGAFPADARRTPYPEDPFRPGRSAGR